MDGKPGITVTGKEEWRLTVNLNRGVNLFEVYGVDYFGNISKPISYNRSSTPDVPNDHFIDAILLIKKLLLLME